MSGYEFILRDCLRYPLLIAGVGALLLVLTLQLYSQFQLGVEFFPEVDPRRAEIKIEFPEATEINKTDAMTREVERRLKKYQDIAYTLSAVGSGGGNLFAGGASGTYLASVSVEFKDMPERRFPSPQVVDAIRLNLNGFMNFTVSPGQANAAPGVTIAAPAGTQREAASLRIIVESLLRENGADWPVSVETSTPSGTDEGKSITVAGGAAAEAVLSQLRKERRGLYGAEIVVKKEKDGPQVDSPISIDLSGEDYPTLARLVEQIKKRIESVPGLVDLRDNFDSAKPELKFVVDRNRAALLNLDTSTIGVFIRTAINGFEVSKYREDEDEYDITVRLPAKSRTDTDTLLNMLIPIPDHNPVALSSIGNFLYTNGYGTIHRKNMKKTITIDGDVRPGYGVDQVLGSIKRELAAAPLPGGYSVRYRGEDEKQNEAAEFLFKAFWIAIFLILIILVAQFNSIFVPGVILSSVLLSFIGVFASLLIHQMKFSVIMTGIGIICLAGVVVKNAIVLIDCIQLQRSRGMDVYEATVTAGKFRLRPVLLTAITAVLGLVPMAVGWSLDFHSLPPVFSAGAESSQWWRLMALVVIYGLSVATILTLVLVPCLYYQLELWRGRFFQREE